MEPTIKETCSCGALFEVSGRETFCDYRYKEFLKAHKICRAMRKPPEPVSPADDKSGCNCSWDYVTGESPNYYCGKCSAPMR